ncbi:NifB/NifX family molybdenum-iron cluster-binding protein [Chloroflexota bacterium]
MKYAIPVSGGVLCPHFGHCEQFALIDVDEVKKEITKKELVAAPEHQPGLLPPWLAQQGVNCVIAGGMGMNAQNLFQNQGVKVIVGALEDKPEKAVLDYLNGKLATGDNVCDH